MGERAPGEKLVGRARDDFILERLDAGVSMTAVGLELGLTRERVRQLAKKAGVTGKQLRIERQQGRDRDLQLRAAQVAGMVHAGFARQQIVDHLGEDAVRQSGVQAGRARSADPAARQAKVIEALRASHPDGVRSTNDLSSTLLVRVYQEFDDLHVACAAAGIPCTVRRLKVERADRVPESELLEALVAFLRDPTVTSPSFQRWRSWSGERGVRGKDTVRFKFGSWGEALEAAREEVRRRSRVTFLAGD